MNKLPFGEVQGKDKNGIIAYSCYDPKHDSNSFVTINKHKFFCGIKWQCIEYVRRWLILMLNISFDQVDNAYMLYKHATFFDIHTHKHITHRRHSNLSKSLPHAGSIIIWDKDDKQPTGHVAVITKIKGNTVYICEQNWTFEKWHHNYSRKIIVKKQTFRGTERHSLCSNNPLDDSILGWLSLQI